MFLWEIKNLPLGRQIVGDGGFSISTSWWLSPASNDAASLWVWSGETVVTEPPEYRNEALGDREASESSMSLRSIVEHLARFRRLLRGWRGMVVSVNWMSRSRRSWHGRSGGESGGVSGGWWWFHPGHWLATVTILMSDVRVTPSSECPHATDSSLSSLGVGSRHRPLLSLSLVSPGSRSQHITLSR